jgi:aminoglycoside/choline kinase family phosphotransferase
MDARIVDWLCGPKASQKGNRLVETLTSLLHRDARRGEVIQILAAGTHSDQEPSFRSLIDVGQLLGRHRRRIPGKDEGGRPNADAFGLFRQARQPHERFRGRSWRRQMPPHPQRIDTGFLPRAYGRPRLRRHHTDVHEICIHLLAGGPTHDFPNPEGVLGGGLEHRVIDPLVNRWSRHYQKPLTSNQGVAIVSTSVRPAKRVQIVSVNPLTGPWGLTSEWLTDALEQAGHHGVRVTDVSVEEIGTGQTGASFRMHVSFADRTDLPSTFVAKLPADDAAVRERVALGYRAEVAFYDTVAATVRVPVPQCFVSAISPDAQSFVLILEDLAPARQGDQLVGCTRAQALVGVQALAGLHGPRWCDPAWHAFGATALPTANEALAKGLGDVARMATDMFVERLGGRLSEADRQTLGAYPERIPTWLLAYPQRFSLLHGDYRLDNLMFTPDNSSVVVVDWQTLSVGLPARDLAYFVGTSLPTDNRAEHEHALVKAYHSALLDFGVCDYPLETCFDDYRIGMLQAPLIATLGAAFSATTERGDEMMLVMLERTCEAIRSLGTLAMIDREAS